MKILTRDIVITLSVKIVLLIALWWICFKDVEKPEKDVSGWLLGTGSAQVVKVDLPKV